MFSGLSDQFALNGQIAHFGRSDPSSTFALNPVLFFLKMIQQILTGIEIPLSLIAAMKQISSLRLQ